MSHAKFTRRSLLGTAMAGTALAVVPGTAGAADTAILPPVDRIPHRPRLVDYEIVELAALLRAGKTSSVELTRAYLERIAKFNGPFEVYGDNGLYNAFVRIDADAALAAARAADERLAEFRRRGGALSPLCGIPMGIKDSIGVKGMMAQDGSPAFAGNRALRDATAVARLRAAGVVPLGMTMCSEFSGSVVGTFSGNAWNLDHVPGGSSQGSGVAPVARLAAACLGEETGGSIICPSAANGATGIKPSPGTVSAAGLMPLAPGYDVIGPIARSARDSALVLSAILGPDPVNDPQTLAPPNPFPAIPFVPRVGKKPLQGLTIGIPQTDWMYVNYELKPGVAPQSLYGAEHRQVFTRLVEQLRALGARVIEFPGLDITNTKLNPYLGSPDVLATVDGSPVSPSGAVINSNNYEVRYAEAVDRFCASGIPSAEAVATLTEVYGRRAPGETAPSFASANRLLGGIPASARYEGEQRRRTLIANYAKALADAKVDFMLVMTIADVIGRRAGPEPGFPVMRAGYQVPNVLGWPMVSFPTGFARGLPVSAQFWGPRFTEPTIIQAMIDYQAHHPEYHTAVPPDPALPTTRKIAPKPAPLPPNAPTNDPLRSDQAIRKAMGR
ncbi:amidase [Allokutzneria albata]|uniref:Aspartyl-tRNA(Asn)/glutamyl-tRNA(Gln) amidotransferase subunit A n=1 Tax=Allokutzneria albata TaxID=211114 RepID=A0A1G9U7Y3_ALLAB|nr:amidase [Allokutzneria albata]SDM55784.1 aspartyl-tRNA(Asn)/glutamyl-tRNA(Gln) amidotransferase subunit A [Allokutzneria albata]